MLAVIFVWAILMALAPVMLAGGECQDAVPRMNCAPGSDVHVEENPPYCPHRTRLACDRTWGRR